ncbi:MAG: hypothetical protein IJP35_07855 [Clostridia bacterium]|nr:hypothetical protein [Clostridia bacterium]
MAFFKNKFIGLYCIGLVACFLFTACHQDLISNPLMDQNGNAITTKQQWEAACTQKKERLQQELYGIFPESTGAITAVNQVTVPLPECGAMMEECILRFGDGLQETLRITYPDDEGKYPVIFRLDYLSDYEYRAPIEEQMLLEKRYAFVTIGRKDVAPDEADNRDGLPAAYLEKDLGAIALWAYGAVAAADYVSQKDFADTDKFCITGHSRDGKAAICAGVMDDRFKVIAPNGSGVGGAASLSVQGKDSESASHLAENFPHWFSSSFNKAVANNTLTIDMTDAFCVLAPRAVLRTEAENDQWANPDGVLAIKSAMDPVYEFLGVDTAYNQVVFRKGDHGHTLADWNTLIDFCDFVFKE